VLQWRKKPVVKCCLRVWENDTVKTIAVELPDRVTEEIDLLVQNGWFADEAEIMRMALWEFVHRNRFALMEQFQRADIAWALQQRHDLRAGEAAQ
jgi:Arc/MetJ-type ribon-helix-helix transcriptional regulator